MREGFTFAGRARRMEYWMFILFQLLITIAAGLIIQYLPPVGVNGVLGVFTIYILATIPASVSVEVRRLHDIGYSGWWFFISYVPLIGPFFSFMLHISSGTKGVNKYGADPKGNNVETMGTPV